MYSYEDRLRAVRLYIKLGKRIGLIIRQRGYPTKNALKTGYREYEKRRHDLPAGYARLQKYSRLRRNGPSSTTSSKVGASQRRSSHCAIPRGHCCPPGFESFIRSARAVASGERWKSGRVRKATSAPHREQEGLPFDPSTHAQRQTVSAIGINRPSESRHIQAS